MEEEAISLIQDESSRTIQPVRSEDPANSTATSFTLSANDLNIMRQQFPFLKDFSDEFLRSNRPECLIKMGATSLKMREIEKSRDAEDRLASNRTTISSTTYPVKEGIDNRIVVQINLLLGLLFINFR